jgi:hypothetical protein
MQNVFAEERPDVFMLEFLVTVYCIGLIRQTDYILRFSQIFFAQYFGKKKKKI